MSVPRSCLFDLTAPTSDGYCPVDEGDSPRSQRHRYLDQPRPQKRAGVFAFAIFALGLIGTGLLAVPVLAGSAAYALGETFGLAVWARAKDRACPSLLGAIAIATLLGAAMNFSAVDPIKALFCSVVRNGVAAVAIMAMITVLAMGQLPFARGKKVWDGSRSSWPLPALA
jgi:hypothetical protein